VVSFEEYYLTSKLLADYRSFVVYSSKDRRGAVSASVSFKKLFPPLSSSSSFFYSFNSLELLLQICEISFKMESHLFSRTKDVFFQSIQPFLLSSTSSSSSSSHLSVLTSRQFNSYSFITSQSLEWEKERETMLSQYYFHDDNVAKGEGLQSSPKKKKLKIEYITYASNMTDGVENLLFSSILSGVKLKVCLFPSLSFLLPFTLLSSRFWV
jgi:hypothetical protein